MSSTAPPVVPNHCRRVVIEGLEKIQDAKQISSKRTSGGQNNSSTFSTIMHEDEPLSELWTRIADCGFYKPVVMTIDDERYFEDEYMRVVSDHEEVVVVAEDQISTKSTIRITESLISHANTHHGEQIDFDIAPLPSSKRAIEANCGFHMSLERTPRMPDDNKLHQLPGSLGSYDLFSVESYADRLPANIGDSGGVFFPMWQREAMWLNFEPTIRKCAVRIFMGHVNAISGLTMEETANDENDELEQDYIVIPGQRWLDGICVAPGVVRQFVAMPLGSGYTVEGQKTSKEQHGGLQLEITPEGLPNLRLWSYNQKKFLITTNQGTPIGIEETMTPQQLHCEVGDILRSYPADRNLQEPLKMKHLVESGNIITCTAVNGERDLRDELDERLIEAREELMRRRVQLEFINGRESPASGMPTPPFMPSPIGFDIPMIVAKSTKYLGPPSPDVAGYICGWGCEEEADLMGSQDEDDDGDEDCVDDVGGEEGTDVPDLQVIETKNIKAMGLAAGGKLIQDIYKDPYPPTTWNHAAARILHIHILDPVSCEKVTHIVPTPPSTDVKAYTEAGGKYFVVEEKVDERLVGGDFDNVKSVSQMDQHIGISTEPEFDPNKPKMCTTCELRLCDCIIRPCDHQFCNICIKRIDQNSDEDVDLAHRNWKCPICDSPVSHVAGFSAPMNLPGEEPLRIKVPVNVLKIEDGRVRFESVQRSRV